MKNNNGLMRLLVLLFSLCLVLAVFAVIAPVEAEATEEQTIIIYMHDVFGDGWGNNAISVRENGVEIGVATFTEGKEGTWTYTMDPSKEYAFVWVKGAWSSECFFEIYIAGEMVFSATTTDCNLYVDGKVLYPLCKHLHCDAVVTPPTCKKDGYTTYTCTGCGFSYVDDETSATGHYFGDDDFCDYCGFDINSIHVVITMTDSYGDGWNGNAIEVYEAGVLIETITLESGMRNDTWEYDFDRSKEYDFFWKKGNFSNECSFTISYDDEVMFTATQSICNNFKDHDLIYPPCTHINCDAVVTAPTCTKFGFTTYTCTKCGHVSIGNIVLSMGHQYGNDSICDTCGYDKDGITINMTDSYGDGWGSNAIEVYADGVLVGTATLSSGSEGSYFLAVDKSKEYSFRWVKGYSTYECSFEIQIAGETKYYASGSDSDKLISGQQIYPYVEYSGWTELGNKVYYFDPVNHKHVLGVNRLPYPTMPINGITYGPNPEDVAYAESQGKTFIDMNEAWFFFDSYTGEFKSSTTGVWSLQVEDTYGYRYVVNGMIPWNMGLVKDLGYYYYFAGDEIYGGNTVVYGDVIVTRNNSDFDMVAGGVYTFDWMGHMCNYDGITNVDGVLRYYENCRLMTGNGLTRVDDKYIFVKSSGELVVDAEYYVPGNALGIASGIYSFDENGFMVDPVSSDKFGVHFENGAWYYYEDGKIAYNKGMMAYNGGYIYVRSNGMLATGTYYITNIPANLAGQFQVGQKVTFDENGYAQTAKNGIHEIDGALYYFVNNHIQYNAGLMELSDGYIYVRSNGMLATGKYWVSNTNGVLDSGFYEFGEDGYLVVCDGMDGVVENNGLAYYENGMKKFGLGLVQLENGSYIYVRTDGELAVGPYWVTNSNGLLEEGVYEFGEDGILTVN